jgi:hypothetical protein
MLDDFLDEECKKLAISPGDWLEERRWKMSRLDKRRRWDGGREFDLDQNVVSLGVAADQALRAARRAPALTQDEKLNLMGNRKGIGIWPISSPARLRIVDVSDTE